MIAPHLVADHGHALGMKNIDVDDVPTLLAAYMMDEPQEEHEVEAANGEKTKVLKTAGGQAHIARRSSAMTAHLHSHFRIKPPTPKPAAGAPAEGAK